MTAAIIISGILAVWLILSFWSRSARKPDTRNYGNPPKPRPPSAPDHGDNGGWP